MHPRTRPYLLAVLIAMATGMTYWPATHNAFVWDDIPYILENPSIRGLGPQFFNWAFTSFHSGNWHPLTWISHALDIRLWGLDPRGHHLINIVLHSLNTLILFFLTLRLVMHASKRSTRKGESIFMRESAMLVVAGTTSLFFGIHPVHVESVAWVAERKDLLCAMFFMLSIFIYIGAPHPGMDGSENEQSISEIITARYLTSFGFFLLALMSKPMAVTLPAVLLILDWYPLGRIRCPKTLRSNFLTKIPFLTCSIAASFITIAAQGSAGAIHSTVVTPITTRIFVCIRSMLAYLEKILFPRDLSPFYPYPQKADFLSSEYLFPVVILILITAACIINRVKHPLYLAIFGFYAVTLLPVLGIVPVGWQAMADRYLYLPGIGPLMLTGLGVGLIYDRAGLRPEGRRALNSLIVIPVLIIAALLAIRTDIQIRIWKDSITLWSHVIKTQPPSILAFNNRGSAFAAAGQTQPAIDDFLRAIEIDPGYYEIFNSLGIEYGKLGRFDKAVEVFNRSLTLVPENADALLNRGTASLQLGDRNRALDDYNAVIRFHPKVAPAYLNRGKILESTGDLAHARADYQAACALENSEACDILRSLTD